MNILTGSCGSGYLLVSILVRPPKIFNISTDKIVENVQKYLKV